jgi:hypothetical protein
MNSEQKSSIEEQIYTDESLEGQELQEDYRQLLLLANDKMEELKGKPHRGSNLLNPVDKVLTRF